MRDSIITPIKITLTIHGETFTVDGIQWDADANTLKNMFSRILVSAGFSPSVIDTEGGAYVWEEALVEPLD